MLNEMLNEMLTEHDLIALKVDQPDYSLRAGDTGTIVSVHAATHAYTVEFMTLGGETVALLTLPEAKVRPVAGDEIAQARPLAAAA